MELESLRAVFSALLKSEARFLVAGGLAVIAHGYVRATEDLDLILDLSSPNAERALAALQTLGYSPLNPVAIESFANPEKRLEWITTKNAKVFQLYSDVHPSVRIDLFLDEPLDFEQALQRASWQKISEGNSVPFVALRDLLELKRKAGRPKDLIDLDRLGRIHRPPDR